MDIVLEVKGLNAYYGKAHIIKDVTFELYRSEIFAILGRNGVGKTTLLKSIIGLDVRRTGKITLEKEDITKLKPYEIARKGIFFIPDDTGLFPGMNVLENFMLVKGSKKIDLKSLVELYPQLIELVNRKADVLSGGERKIVAILRSLLINPKVLLCDEISEGVMPIMVRKIYSILSQLRNNGISIILVEPSTKLKQVLEIADRVAVMEKGRIVYIGHREDVKNDLEKIEKYLFV